MDFIIKKLNLFFLTIFKVEPATAYDGSTTLKYVESDPFIKL